MPLIEKMRYNPEIDGLRAIAVVAVVWFHLGKMCSGGYVGVDIFFVISGYLITSLIWHDLENNNFSLINFWERRARRILPALFVVTIAAFLAAWFLLLPADLKSLGEASAMQVFFSANIYYHHNTGYFLGNAHEKPLLHTWSLSVEEQFYLVVPLLLWLVFRFRMLCSRRFVISLLAVGFVASLLLSIRSLPLNENATFYLLPMRAWELLLGSIIAFLPTSPRYLKQKNVRQLLAFTGLALMVIPIFTYTEKTPFPGIAALPPCLGAGLVILSSRRHESLAPTFIGSLLSMRPFVFIGLISYSLYLWHWPIIAFVNYISLEHFGKKISLLIFALSVVCAILSWHYVETPFRKKQIAATRKTMFVAAGLGLSFILLISFASYKTQGFPQRFSQQSQRFSEARYDSSFQNEILRSDILEGKLPRIGATKPNQKTKVLVWGDSFAMSALPAIDIYFKEQGIVGLAATHSLTPPVLDWADDSLGLKKETIPFNNAVFNAIQQNDITDVILISCWPRFNSEMVDTSSDFSKSLLTTVKKLKSENVQPWILLAIPAQKFDVPKVLALQNRYSPDYISSLRSKPDEDNGPNRDYPQLMAKVKAAGGRVIDPKPRFLDATKKYYIYEKNGFALYRDETHMTTKGAILILLPFFREVLEIEK